MRNAILFILCNALFLTGAAQLFQQPCLDSRIFYAGKASYNIDGKITDWQTLLLGPYSGNNNNPYIPTSGTKFNTTLDQSCPGVNATPVDSDLPAPENDIRFLARTYDDYNVYFYFRRLNNTNGVKSFYYFIDTNADGFMGRDEPVIGGVFNSNQIIKYSYNYYIPNENVDFVEGKGNYMYSPVTKAVDGYTMPGKIVELYSSKKVSEAFNLNSNEVFDAALTEDGYGVELSIPWKVLSTKLGGTPLNAKSIITYHVALQDMNFPYRPDKVEDNAGECCGQLGKIGVPSYTASDSRLQTVISHTSYKLTTQLTNNSNITEELSINALVLDNLVGTNVDRYAVVVTGYTDINCNGMIDFKETPVIYTPQPAGSGEIVYRPSSPISTTTASGMKACFIVTVTFPSNSGIQSFTPLLGTEVRSPELPSGCLSGIGCTLFDNGRPINPIGFQQRDIGDGEVFKTTMQPNNYTIEGSFRSMVYPNPSKGSVTISLSGNIKEMEVSIFDHTGRAIRTYKNISTSKLGVNDLRNGSYLILINNKRTGERTVNKLLVY